jgi:hypothetical protein
MNCLPGKVAICDDDRLLIGSSAGSPESPDDTLKVRRFHCAWKAVAAKLPAMTRHAAVSPFFAATLTPAGHQP